MAVGSASGVWRLPGFLLPGSRKSPGGLLAAQVGHLWPLAGPMEPSNVLKCAPGGSAPQKGLHFSQKAKRSSLATGGPDLLKWSLPGGGIKSAKVAPTLCMITLCLGCSLRCPPSGGVGSSPPRAIWFIALSHAPRSIGRGPFSSRSARQNKRS